MWLVLVVGIARADVAGTPREQALRLYGQAEKMLADKDHLAAAVTFGQVAQILGRLDRDAVGAVVDAEAHAYRVAALSNRATAYSLGQYYVEAYDAFVELLEQVGAELEDKERERVKTAIARTGERIGTIRIAGLPAGDPEVRIDGRLVRRDPRAPLRLDEGPHAIDVTAAGYRPYAAKFVVVRNQETAVDLALEELRTPARLRVETTVDASVAIDGVARGDSPVEITVPPGKHRVAVAADSYAPAQSEVDVRPGERTVVRLGMIRARAPLGLRMAPAFVGGFPLRTDTPFGSFDPGIAVQVFHDALRPLPTLRIGATVEYHARSLNSAGVGAVVTWCSDRFATASGSLAWCPVAGAVTWMFGEREGLFDSGDAAARVLTAFEARRRSGFVRLGAGVAVTDYRRVVDQRFLVLWSSVVEVSVGVDL